MLRPDLNFDAHPSTYCITDNFLWPKITYLWVRHWWVMIEMWNTRLASLACIACVYDVCSIIVLPISNNIISIVISISILQEGVLGPQRGGKSVMMMIIVFTVIMMIIAIVIISTILIFTATLQEGVAGLHRGGESRHNSAPDSGKSSSSRWCSIFKKQLFCYIMKRWKLFCYIMKRWKLFCYIMKRWLPAWQWIISVLMIDCWNLQQPEVSLSLRRLACQPRPVLRGDHWHIAVLYFLAIWVLK